MAGLMAIFIISFVASCRASFSCPGAWQMQLDNSCYMILIDNLTWIEASERCRENGGHLAIITSDKEQNYLHEYTARHYTLFPLWRYWMDGKDVESENHWYWDWTGKQIKYFFWRKGQPDNFFDLEHCLGQYGDGKWNDFRCDTKSHAMCEKEMVDVN